MDDRAVLFANAKSRRGAQWFEQARKRLPELGVRLERARTFKRPAEISDAVGRAVSEGIGLICLGGGDGTFSANARHFVGSEAVLGVLPFGTGNALARDLEIPFDVEGACQVIAKGREARIDLGVAGDDYFVNVVTAGLTVRIVEELTTESKRRLGRFVYLLALVKAVARVRPFRAKITTEKGVSEFDTLQVVIGSGRFHAGPFPISPDAVIDDGVLEIYSLASTSRWDLLRMALKLPGGRHVEMSQVCSMTAKGGTLETWPSQRVNVDGEICMNTPVRFAIAPAAIAVRVPATFEAST